MRANRPETPFGFAAVRYSSCASAPRSILLRFQMRKELASTYIRSVSVAGTMVEWRHPVIVRLGKLFGPVQRRLTRVDLREHEDKILLLLALVISAVVGLIVVAFVAVTERMGRVLVNAGAMQRFLSPLVGSLVGGWLLFKYFPDARGSGIPRRASRWSCKTASSAFERSSGSSSALPSPWVAVWRSAAKAPRSISARELHRRRADVSA